MKDPFLDPGEREAAFAAAVEAALRYLEDPTEGGVLPAMDDDAIEALVASADFDHPMGATDAVALAVAGLRRGQVHTSHPRYFGLFNPPSSPMGAVGDLLAAAFNPQLATRSHAPFPVVVERRLLGAFAARFGFAEGDVEGCFTSGGAEANATALACALATAFPAWSKSGVRALAGDPVVFASSEAHHSLEKAARTAGLGDGAVRRVATDAAMRMQPGALRAAIAEARAKGRLPAMIVATCGTTSAGAIDPLAAVAEVAERERVWLHVDAAWGGLAALVPALRGAIAGVERADSLTFDAHKALAVPMGAGMYLSRKKGALARAFATTAAYMPRGDEGEDPYATSLQWSRRFAGLKVFLTLATLGFGGYAEVLRREVAVGRALRARLEEAGWRVVNETPLPIVCFVDAAREDGATGKYLAAVARYVAAEGQAWISVTRVRGGARVLRACVTNPRTTEADADALAEALGRARAALPR